jgi:hypothetical protein
MLMGKVIQFVLDKSHTPSAWEELERETSIVNRQRKVRGGMAMAAEEEGRKGIPSLLSSREENIASNVTEVPQSSPPLRPRPVLRPQSSLFFSWKEGNG